MLPEATVIHALPDRLRLRVREKRRDAQYFAAVDEWLSAFPGAIDHDVQPLTGSILFYRDAAFAPRDFAEQARRAGMFDLSMPVPDAMGSESGDPLTDMQWRRCLRQAMVGLLVAMAIVQINRGQIMAPAISMLSYAFDIAAHLRD
jgi:hypothetical protein